MKTVVFGKHSKAYLIALDRWARKLEATDMVLHKDGTVTLSCKDGGICNNYRPTAEELRKAGAYEY